ncbi:hypothetical protein CORC01_06388 [Colletotrichum orchidophilum]|uniref:Uncharacterized protein n=1 Tax=Colletotrichum orchidophilum TaxID=1209926 RepID=A0A1G4BAR9_9PEZI|nr:uncharacterized protein CORC01_06388 [Colletotrichum orchidophilum]OHE98392.1 hypothetical protein CORC01_06388 [Colletotrichum orchidophilum]
MNDERMEEIHEQGTKVRFVDERRNGGISSTSRMRKHSCFYFKVPEAQPDQYLTILAKPLFLPLSSPPSPPLEKKKPLTLPRACLTLLYGQPDSYTTSTIERYDIMGQAQEDMATAIFDIAHQFLASFDSVVAEHEESVLTRSFTPKDAVGNSGSQRRPSFDFLGLHISSMVIELLEMILRNVQRSSQLLVKRFVGNSETA